MTVSRHEAALGTHVAVLLAAGLAVCSCDPGGGALPPNPSSGAECVAESAGAGVFAVTGSSAGLDFRHSIGDAHLDNVVEAMGSGGVVLDFDGDGFMDLYLVDMAWRGGISGGEDPGSAVGNRLFRNRGDGTFMDATAGSATGDAGFGVAAAAADYDGDGRTDLYVVNAGANVLLRNLGDGRFEDVTTAAGIADEGIGAGAVFFDADGDGDLDLYVANYVDFDADYDLYFPPDGFPGPLSYEARADVLYRNRGDGTFEDISTAAGIAALRGRGMGVTALDVDGDGDTDLFVANDASPNFLLLNDGRGVFTESALESGVAFGTQGEATAAMAAIAGDADGDGRTDLLVTDAAYGSLFHGLGGGRFDDIVFPSGAAAPMARSPSWGAAWLDFDNDGDSDVMVVSGDLHHPVGRHDLLLENDGTGHFVDASALGGPWFGRCTNGRACLAADFDNDGDTDIVITHLGGSPVLLRNERGSTGSWITVVLSGRAPLTDGTGAEVLVSAGGRRMWSVQGACGTYLGQGDPRLHFGLGAAEVVDRIEVRWPSGAVSVLENLPARRFVTVREETIR